MSPCCYLGLAFSVSFLSQGFLGLSRTSLSLSVPPEFCCSKLDTVDLIETRVRVKTQTWSIQDSIKPRPCLSCIEVRYRSKEWVSNKLFLKKSILLFSKNTLNWSKVTSIISQKVSIWYKLSSFDISIHQRILKNSVTVSTKLLSSTMVFNNDNNKKSFLNTKSVHYNDFQQTAVMIAENTALPSHE